MPNQIIYIQDSQALATTDPTPTLLKAVDVIISRGWCQNTLSSPDGRVCLEGALVLAAGVHPAAVHGQVKYTQLDEAAFANFYAALHAVNQVLPLPAFAWNDEMATSQDDVIRALKEAAERG